MSVDWIVRIATDCTTSPSLSLCTSQLCQAGPAARNKRTQESRSEGRKEKKVRVVSTELFSFLFVFVFVYLFFFFSLAFFIFLQEGRGEKFLNFKKVYVCFQANRK